MPERVTDGRVRRTGLMLGMAASLSACANYRPAPVTPAAMVVDRAGRALSGPTRWTTADLLTRALDWSPTIRESAANHRALAAAARAARVPLPAVLQLTAEYSRDDNPDKPWLGSGIVDLPLDVGGVRHRRTAAADLVALQARYDHYETVWAVRSLIRHAVIDRIFADRLRPLAVRGVALVQDRAAKLHARIDEGEEARPVSITARRDVAAAERRLGDVELRRGQADAALSAAIGVDPAAVAGLMLEPLAGLPMAPSPADLARWRQEAAAGRRDVLRAIVEYDVAENAVRLEVGNQYPGIRVLAGYTYERGLVKLPFGLALALPPVDLNRAAILAAQERRAQVGAHLEAVAAAILAAVDRSATMLRAQIAAEQTSRLQDLPIAEGLALRASEGLRAGELDRIDEDAARETEVDARIAVLEAERAAWIALADLDDALQRPSDPRDAAVLAAAAKRLGDDE